MLINDSSRATEPVPQRGQRQEDSVESKENDPPGLVNGDKGQIVCEHIKTHKYNLCVQTPERHVFCRLVSCIIFAIFVMSIFRGHALRSGRT